MTESGPIFGAAQATAAKTGTPATQFAQYFAAAWDTAAPERRRSESSWPLKPWDANRKPAFMGWTKNTLLPRFDLPLAQRLVDEFCAHHDRYFSPASNVEVWKQFATKLDRLAAAVTP